MATMADSSGGGKDVKDASATTATTPVQRGRWHRCNNGKDVSNRGNATGNSQPAQQKDKRVDKRSGVEDTTRTQLGGPVHEFPSIFFF
jgi:hypothetical protein